MLSQVKSPAEIESMRKGGAILARGLQLMKEAATAGISTKALSDIAEKHIKDSGAQPAFLNFPGSGGANPFPEVACISVNDAVVHGIPNEDYILKDGDVVSLDLGVIFGGMIVDGALTVIVGGGNNKQKELLRYTQKSLYEGLKKVKNGCWTGDIGAAIESVLRQGGYGIVRDLVGHGVGYSVHEDPNIPNYGKSGTGVQLKSGMTVAIEPMATLGGKDIYVDQDGWTVRTQDGSTAAHFEHTILVTNNGCEILTTPH